MPKSKNQEHLSPDNVFDLIWAKWKIKKEYLFDPVPIGTPFKSPCFFNGLYGNWKIVNYINPPFEIKTLTAFVKKAIEQANEGRISIMLLPAKTDQAWFHDLLLKNNFEILWIRKRLKFKNNIHHATGSHFLVFITFTHLLIA
jgi:hypothetical protein